MNNYSVLDLLTLLGAVGLFLYGMKVMSEGLQKVAGDRMRTILSAMTRNRFSGVATGVLITALIQSSSASTVMVVSFVNAGLMSLQQSMAVIMGANVGTTFTAWIIAIVGVKVSVGALAVPFIAVAVLLLFSKSSRSKSIGEFIIGFSFLFMGLGMISANVPELDANTLEFLADYSNHGFASVLLFIFVGLVITMIIQSSAATFAIVLVMSTKGWIGFDMACAAVLGSNIGTTITPVLASLSANQTAKKAALGHFLFNLFGTVWTTILFFPFVKLVIWITEMLGQGNPTALQGDAMAVSVSFGLSIFHTVFNIINLSVMIWFTESYVKICNYFIKSNAKDGEEFQLKYISSGLLNASELNIMQAQREIVVYAQRVQRMYDMVVELVHTKLGTVEFNKLYSRVGKYEEISDRMEIEIAKYLNRVVDGRLSYEGKLRISAMLNIISEIESIADSCFNIAKSLIRKEEAHVHFVPEQYQSIDEMMKLVSEAITDMIIVLANMEHIKGNDLTPNINKENEINNYRNLLRTENIENINKKLYEYQSGIFFMDIISESERIGDYIVNVIEGVESQYSDQSALSPTVTHK